MRSRHYRKTSRALVLVGLVAGLLGAAARPAAAHDFWLVPSSCHPAPGAPLAFRLRVGEGLRGDPVPRDPAKIERFALLGVAGPERPILGPPAAEPAGYLPAPPPGLYQIVYRSRRERVDLPAPKFEEYLTLEGLDAISALRKSRGESGKPSTEVYSRCAKSLLVSDVGGAAPGAGAGFDRAAGMELEIVPEKNPYALAPGAELPVRLLYRGKPLAGAMVFALSLSHRDKTAADRIARRLSGRTGRDGRVSLRLPEGGFWLVEAVHMIPAPRETGVDWESLWASLTFDLPAR